MILKKPIIVDRGITIYEPSEYIDFYTIMNQGFNPETFKTFYNKIINHYKIKNKCTISLERDNYGDYYLSIKPKKGDQ